MFSYLGTFKQCLGSGYAWIRNVWPLGSGSAFTMLIRIQQEALLSTVFQNEDVWGKVRIAPAKKRLTISFSNFKII